MDILKLIDQLESLVEDSRHLGILNLSIGLDREEFFELTNKLRASLPDEVRKACRVTAESERIVGGAREAAALRHRNTIRLQLCNVIAQSRSSRIHRRHVGGENTRRFVELCLHDG